MDHLGFLLIFILDTRKNDLEFHDLRIELLKSLLLIY